MLAHPAVAANSVGVALEAFHESYNVLARS